MNWNTEEISDQSNGSSCLLIKAMLTVEHRDGIKADGLSVTLNLHQSTSARKSDDDLCAHHLTLSGIRFFSASALVTAKTMCWAICSVRKVLTFHPEGNQSQAWLPRGVREND